jgi:hypothetical protein
MKNWSDPRATPFALARLDRLTYVRFALDHAQQIAKVLNVGPQEAAHSSANGIWVHAQIEPLKPLHRVEDVAGCTLRLMGHPFRGDAVYAIVRQAVEHPDRELVTKD